MKRLKSKLGIESGGIKFDEIYEGTLRAVWGDNSPPTEQRDPTYYAGEIGYTYDRTHKLAPDRPTVTVEIPVEHIFLNGMCKGADNVLKRLLYYLKQMENDTTTYRYYDPATHSQRDLYDGELTMNFPPKSNGDMLLPEKQSDPKYWNGEISYELERTNKLAPDKPTVTVAIPAESVGAEGRALESEAFARAAADFCLRALAPYIDALNGGLYNRSRPDADNGKYYLYSPGGEVLTRNTAYFALCGQKDYENGSGSVVFMHAYDKLKPPLTCLCIKLQIQLPRKRLRRTIQMLCRDLPDTIDEYLARFDLEGLARTLELAEKQVAVRDWLSRGEYCAFIANGSVLPRSKGTDLPMEGAVPFKSTPDDEVLVCGVRGMAIKRGVTVVTGGGYSGKSTLLDAISAGIYDHRAGDGRELVLTDGSAVTISAEDGRSVKNVNISPFIKWLPGGDTRDFSTDRASGSTSQAANIMEAVNTGSRLLLLDEDRSATNFMIRDAMMKRLIEREPITPFTDRVRELYERRGVSTILVIGGSGEYLSVADRVYMMDDFVISDATKRAKAIYAERGEPGMPPEPAGWIFERTLLAGGFTPYPEGSGSERLEASDTGFILIGDEKLDTRMLHDIATDEQRTALAFMLRRIENEANTRTVDLDAAVEKLYAELAGEGLDVLYSGFFTTMGRFLDLPRPLELRAAISRMRKVVYSK